MKNNCTKTNLGKLLDYIQPTKYIVNSINYNDNFKTPVLTPGKSFIKGYTDETEGIYNDLPTIIFDDFTTASRLVNFPFKVKSSAMKILKPSSELVNMKYVFYSMQVLNVRSDTHKRYWISIYSKENIPLPPLPIQRAIVSKIEQLFSELDNGIQNLQQAKNKIAVFRQAVLKKAFEGVKTKVRVNDIAHVRTGATPKKGKKEFWHNGTVPWITSTVVNNNKVTEPTDYITETALKETNCKLIPKGSLVVAMYGEGKTRGKCSELFIDTATNQALAAITLFEENIDSRLYLKYFLLKNYEEIRLLSSGGVQPNLNLTLIKNTELPFPSLDKQHQIVHEIETRFTACDQLEKSIDESLKKAEALRQSILKKAFAGELLTEKEIEACKQEADYEPAEELLKRIEKENNKTKK
ncbi:MAG: restriction endonuclease subunit S [Crocinitomicaceae bacterium]|nr:restriction endonuclease subunit S [Crocinitomicaceae bacterium]